MQDLPHTYQVKTKASASSLITTATDRFPEMTIAPPFEFGGPGDQWSPEDLLMSAISSCFILSFKAIARASSFDWQQLECEAQGILDKEGRDVKFTAVTIKATLIISDELTKEKGEKLLKKAESVCLITNSLTCELALETTIQT